MRFKQFLTEGTLTPVDVREYNIRELLACVRNAGYDTGRPALYSGIKYLKYDKSKKQHVFAMLWFDEDGDEDQQYCINEYYLSLEEHGLEAEPSGTPSACFAREAQGLEALKKM